MPVIATLSANATNANRVGAALGKVLNLKEVDGAPRAATIPEYEDWLRDLTRRMVRGQESIDNHKVVPEPAAVDIT